jgi:hypothetical protein
LWSLLCLWTGRRFDARYWVHGGVARSRAWFTGSALFFERDNPSINIPSSCEQRVECLRSLP